MKTSIIALFISICCYSQDFSGKWTIISLEDETVYANKLNDSIHIKDPNEKTTVEEFRQMAKLYIYPFTYIFKNNGELETYDPMKGNSKGRYEIDRNKNIIVTIEDNGKREEAYFSFKNGILFINPIKENGKTIIGLKKEE